MNATDKLCIRSLVIIVAAFLIITYIGMKKIQEIQIDFFPSVLNFGGCSGWEYPSTVKGSKQPQVVLDPDRFLYPGFTWGPNNQINGLKNAIYLTIRLNRTLVVPSFNAHYTHSETELSPYQIIDVQRLCSFVTCISIEELRERCDASFDVVFEGKMSRRIFIKRYEASTGMAIRKPEKTRVETFSARNLTFPRNRGTVSIPTLPAAEHLARYNYKMPADQSILRSVFNTTAPCAIYASAFNSINIQPINKVALSMTSLNKSLSDVSNEVLYSAITDAVRHPPCIVNAAKNYIRDVLSDREYVGVHWRYDAIDWIKATCRKPYPQWNQFICNNVDTIKPLHIATAIARAVQIKRTSSNLMPNTITVYVAAPNSLKTFVDQIHEELHLIDGGYMKPSSTINSYLKDKFSLCWEKHQWKNIEEIVSLVEMEIMIRSSWFFFSPISTWSENVFLYRTKVNKDKTVSKLFNANVFQMAVDEEKRLRIKTENM